MFQRPTSEDDDQHFTRRSGIRAIVTAKLRRLRGELIWHAGMSVDQSAMQVADAVRWPQAPLIIGEKWDF